MTTSPRDRRTWARRLVVAVAEHHGDGGPAVDGRGGPEPMRSVRLVVGVVADALGVDDPVVASRPGADPAFPADLSSPVGHGGLDLPTPPAGWADPWLPGAVHEQATGGERRAARGAWYTPEPVVRGLVGLAVAGPEAPASIHDPTCGGGAFMLAALDRLGALGLDPAEALTRVSGTDIDPGAVWTARWSVALWARANGVVADPGGVVDVALADALDDAGLGGPVVRADGGPAVIVGNPPFATPLRSGRLPPPAEAYRAANRHLLGPYADLAAIHLLAAVRAVGPDGVVAMVQPQSVLSGRDTGGLRCHLDREAPLQALWATRQAVFDAGVRACAVVVAVGGRRPRSVVLAAGPGVEPVERTDPEPVEAGGWAAHAARALGAPPLPDGLAGTGSGRLGDLVTATAGFRDEYYGLVAACREWDEAAGAEPNRLITVGSVDPLSTAWGLQTCRFGGKRWTRPVIDLDGLEGRVRRWVEQRSGPKVVLASQSKLLEPVVDRDGSLIPATPLVAVSGRPEDLDRVAAVLLAPPVVAWAWQRWFGSAMSVDALKLAARQVLELPLPADRGAWDEAALLVATADGQPPAAAAEIAAGVSALMNRAYGAGPEVLAWWRARGGGPG